MQIEVKDPNTGALYDMEAKPENYYGLPAFRILHENGSSFVITNKSGKWEPADDHIEPDFLVNIALALEDKNLQEQIAHIKT